MFAATTTRALTTTTTLEARPRHPRGLRVRASGANDGAKPQGQAIARRQALKHALNAAFVASVLTAGDRAWAILPGNDDEDEAFLQKAKENRANRIQSEVSKEKAYVNDTGLKQDENTAKIQLAVYKLSKSGGMIESGALADAAGELSGSWVSDTQAGADALGAASEAKSFASAVSALQGKCEWGRCWGKVGVWWCCQGVARVGVGGGCREQVAFVVSGARMMFGDASRDVRACVRRWVGHIIPATNSL